MPPTILKYMEEQFCFEDTAQVLDVLDIEGKTAVVLDRTIFYPQGGGQAFDQGEMQNPDGGAVFTVQEVRFADGIVSHYGVFDGVPFSVGITVTCRVDAERRNVNSRLHSAGHLLDEAVKKLGLDWTPTKGIHFPRQTAVEYAGELGDAEETRARIEAEANKLIQEAHAIRTDLVDVCQLVSLADYVPPNLPADKPVRIVNMGGAKSTPCGGTHVATTADIGRLIIRYVKAKKGNIKVSYDVEGIV